MLSSIFYSVWLFYRLYERTHQWKLFICCKTKSRR